MSEFKDNKQLSIGMHCSHVCEHTGNYLWLHHACLRGYVHAMAVCCVRLLLSKQCTINDFICKQRRSSAKLVSMDSASGINFPTRDINQVVLIVLGSLPYVAKKVK